MVYQLDTKRGRKGSSLDILQERIEISSVSISGIRVLPESPLCTTASVLHTERERERVRQRKMTELFGPEELGKTTRRSGTMTRRSKERQRSKLEKRSPFIASSLLLF